MFSGEGTSRDIGLTLREGLDDADPQQEAGDNEAAVTELGTEWRGRV